GLKRRSASARPRHPTGLLPLLPSGPDGVHSWLSRGNRRGPTLLYQPDQRGAIFTASAFRPFESARNSGYAAAPDSRARSSASRRGGRAVEGARLESVYTPKKRIEGSNPSLSATFPTACGKDYAAGDDPTRSALDSRSTAAGSHTGAESSRFRNAERFDR